MKKKAKEKRYKHLNAEFQRIARRDKKAFFTVQLSHPYMTTGKTIALVNTEIRLIIFFAAQEGAALFSQQKQDRELTVAQIMSSLLPNSDLN